MKLRYRFQRDKSSTRTTPLDADALASVDHMTARLPAGSFAATPIASHVNGSVLISFELADAVDKHLVAMLLNDACEAFGVIRKYLPNDQWRSALVDGPSDW